MELVKKVYLENRLSELHSTATAAEVKTAYESNDDTNAYTDAEKAKLATLDSATTNKGTVGAVTVVASEKGDGVHHVTTLALTDFVVGPLAGAAAAKTLVPATVLYTLPAGVQVLGVSYISIALTATGTAVTPEIGLGSVIGDGSANATIGAAGATMEDIHEGFAVATTVSHAVVKSGPKGATAGILTGISLNKATDAKTIYLNCAGTWNADNTGNLTASGTIVIVWDTIA